LIDTNVLSHAKKAKRNANLEAWFSTQSQVAIPFSALLEIQQGILELEKQAPDRANDLQVWLDAVLRSDFHFPAVNEQVALTLARLYCCGPLKPLWQPQTARKKPGQDLFIAAIAIVHDLPIATLDMTDFVRINHYFKLPGVYHPAFDTWLVPRKDENFQIGTTVAVASIG
jgi:predicted nucleic acid-binding protein